MVDRHFCAWLLRLSGWLMLEDWIDEGSFLPNSPMVGASAHSGVSVRPSDRWRIYNGESGTESEG